MAGQGRAIAVGPKAQALLRGFFTPDPDIYLFSPAAAVGELRAARAAADWDIPPATAAPLRLWGEPNWTSGQPAVG